MVPRPVETGPSSGVSAEGGRSACTVRKRSSTIWRANQTSVPSAKTIVTADKPNRDTLRISALRGTPFIAFSIGNVTVRSTSTGARPGADVMMSTWMDDTSGMASTGSVRSADAPPPSRSTNRQATRTRKRTEARTNEASIPWASPAGIELRARWSQGFGGRLRRLKVCSIRWACQRPMLRAYARTEINPTGARSGPSSCRRGVARACQHLARRGDR